MRALVYAFVAVVGICGAVVFGIILYQKANYPYGRRPCAMRCTEQALFNYASDHDGSFPNSERGHLDALQKLYPGYSPRGDELAGVSGNINEVIETLARGEPLTPEICSWHYVRGLKTNDHPRLAILWESKSGVFGNGRRSPNGSRPVLLLSGDITNVAEKDWSEFRKEQERLGSSLANRTSGANGVQ